MHLCFKFHLLQKIRELLNFTNWSTYHFLFGKQLGWSWSILKIANYMFDTEPKLFVTWQFRGVFHGL